MPKMSSLHRYIKRSTARTKRSRGIWKITLEEIVMLSGEETDSEIIYSRKLRYTLDLEAILARFKQSILRHLL